MTFYFIYGALFLLLGSIAWQDFRDRAIDWYLPILLLGACIGVQRFWMASGTYGLINLAFLAFQFLVLTIYFSLKKGKWHSIINKELGVGDILFFIPLCWLFSPLQFILFFSVGIVLMLLFILIIKLNRPVNTQNIPFAGGLSLILILWISISRFFSISLYNDYLIFDFIVF